MNIFTKKDYLLGLCAGFLTGVFLIPVFINLDIPLPNRVPALIIGFPFLIVMGLWIGGMLARRIAILSQFSKFAATGFLNFAVDFGILNLLILSTGVSVGTFFSVFKGMSFIVANINSYIWNKYWTFRKKVPAYLESLEAEGVPEKKAPKEYFQFLIVSLIGLGINVGMASLVVNGAGVQFGISPELWANVGAVAGAAAGLLWNFVGYKLIVFRK